MKSIRRTSFFKVLILAIGVMGASVIPAQAQAAAGTFTLAHKVRWGGAVLPAGDYTFSLQSQTWPAQLTVRQVGGNAAIFLPRLISEDKMKGASTLLLHEENGESVVSTMRLATLGLELQFATPKMPTPAAETARLAPMADAQTGK